MHQLAIVHDHPDGFQPLFQTPAEFIGARAEFFILDHIQHRIGGGNADGVAAISAAQTARMRCVHQRSLAR